MVEIEGSFKSLTGQCQSIEHYSDVRRGSSLCIHHVYDMVSIGPLLVHNKRETADGPSVLCLQESLRPRLCLGGWVFCF